MRPSNRLQQAIKLLIAHDHALVRASLLSVLGSLHDVIIVARAKDGGEAVRLTRITKPDVVLMDARMPVCNGVNATAQILLLHPRSKILAFSFYGDEESVEDMLDAGAIGYLCKDARPAEVIHAIREIGAGRPYFSHGRHYRTPAAALERANRAADLASPRRSHHQSPAGDHRGQPASMED